MRSICVVTGSRAEYGLLFWLMKEIVADPDLQLQVIVTGNHFSRESGLTYRAIEADGFRIDAKVEMLLASDTAVGITKSIGLGVIGFAEALDRLRPTLVVLLGDRYELLAAAQAAMVARIPIAHIHGGEATEGLIDEAIRHAITKMSHLHFVAADVFRRRVIQLGESPDCVWTVGAAGLDNIARLPLLEKHALEDQLGFRFTNPTLLVTYHPVTLSEEAPGVAMRTLLDVLDETGASIVLTGVNADTGGESMYREAERFASARTERVLLVGTLGTLRYLSLMRHVDAVVGNSSSGLLEAPALGTPSVDIGERQQGRPRPPSVIHCTAAPDDIRSAVSRALSPAHRKIAARKETPYGTPGAAERIVRILRSHPMEGLLIKHFHDLPVELA